MTATEELRALLDERGVEWWKGWNSKQTFFDGANGVRYVADCTLNELFIRSVLPITPQQAVDATLGRGECEPKWVLQGETQTQEFWRCECGNCGECFGVEDRESFPLKITLDKVKLPNYCPNCGKAVKR